MNAKALAYKVLGELDTKKISEYTGITNGEMLKAIHEEVQSLSIA